MKKVFLVSTVFIMTLYGNMDFPKIDKKNNPNEEAYRSAIEKLSPFNPGWCKIKNVDTENFEDATVKLQKM